MGSATGLHPQTDGASPDTPKPGVGQSDGSQRPIAYASCTLASGEKQYCQLEKEGLAVVYGVKKFLLGLQDCTPHLDWTPSTGVVVRSQAPPPSGCATPSPCHPKSQPTQRKSTEATEASDHEEATTVDAGPASSNVTVPGTLGQADTKLNVPSRKHKPSTLECQHPRVPAPQQQQRLQPHPLLGKAQGSGVYPEQKLSA
ncbi:hypothetical protein EMCRGX_G001307 [Ephydatia muelleri]